MIANCEFPFIDFNTNSVFFSLRPLILLLCVPKEVARNAPALHAGPHAFFDEKSLAKKLYNLFGLVVLALVTAFGS